MKKTKTKKTKQKDTKPESKPAPPQENEPFDFGGLPSRDLKKNLGCG